VRRIQPESIQQGQEKGFAELLRGLRVINRSCGKLAAERGKENSSCIMVSFASILNINAGSLDLFETVRIWV